MLPDYISYLEKTGLFNALREKASGVTSSSISDFEIDGKTFEVGGKNKKGKQIKDAMEGPILNAHNKNEFPHSHSGDSDTHRTFSEKSISL